MICPRSILLVCKCVQVADAIHQIGTHGHHGCNGRWERHSECSPVEVEQRQTLPNQYHLAEHFQHFQHFHMRCIVHHNSMGSIGSIVSIVSIVSMRQRNALELAICMSCCASCLAHLSSEANGDVSVADTQGRPNPMRTASTEVEAVDQNGHCLMKNRNREKPFVRSLMSARSDGNDDTIDTCAEAPACSTVLITVFATKDTSK